MSVILIAPNRDTNYWAKRIKDLDPEIDLRIWPDAGNPDDITCAFVWNHPVGSLLPFKNLTLICSMGAGVDHVLKDHSIPANTRIARIVDPAITIPMTNYILMAVLNHHKKFYKFLEDKKNHVWDQIPNPELELSIGILGLGVLGTDAATKLYSLGFRVSGYSNSPKQIEGVKSYAGEKELDKFLSEVNVLICLLPLTSKTRNFMNLALFKKLKHPAYIISVGRGSQMVEEDLLKALELGYVNGAFLDVYQKEPLPKDHPFWDHPKIMMTPHLASITNPDAAIPQMVENYKRLVQGLPIKNLVDWQKEY
jgi:glyoxylate/hydroxypyruvate reductase